MTLLVPDVGEVSILDNMLQTTTPEAQILKLYSNNYDAVEGSVAGDFTEVSGGGYSAASLARASWNGAATVAGVTSKTYPAQTFSFTATRTVVGYFVVGAVSGTLLWAERLYVGSGQVFNNGDDMTVTPRIELA